jgi:hypothetical protein
VVVEGTTLRERLSRCMKSKMPCPPGSRPVMKLDQATGDCGGVVVPSSLSPPRSISAWKFCMRSGNSAIVSRRILGSRPSMPSTTTRG